jgi:hypothetical protein
VSNEIDFTAEEGVPGFTKCGRTRESPGGSQTVCVSASS